jgi:hypothetical protein
VRICKFALHSMNTRYGTMSENKGKAGKKKKKKRESGYEKSANTSFHFMQIEETRNFENAAFREISKSVSAVVIKYGSLVRSLQALSRLPFSNALRRLAAEQFDKHVDFTSLLWGTFPSSA